MGKDHPAPSAYWKLRRLRDLYEDSHAALDELERPPKAAPQRTGLAAHYAHTKRQPTPLSAEAQKAANETLREKGATPQTVDEILAAQIGREEPLTPRSWSADSEVPGTRPR